MNHHNKQFPNESETYRKARNEVLQEEIALRERIEKLGRMRSNLPLGGEIKEDYVFKGVLQENNQGDIHFSQLFSPGKSSLIVYSFMFGPDMEKPCPSCSSFIDTLNANVRHVTDRVNLVVVAKSPLQRILDFATHRGWDQLQLLSSENNTYNKDYFAENEQQQQLPAMNVFTKTNEGIFHFYNTELLYTNLEGHPRHIDLMWPIWNIFDITPEGRGTDWLPKLEY